MLIANCPQLVAVFRLQRHHLLVEIMNLADQGLNDLIASSHELLIFLFLLDQKTLKFFAFSFE